MIEEELVKAGLKERQALVYIALLKNGPGSIQRIARKANIARATTYVIIDSLLELGLVAKKMSGKRPLFIAEKPDRLLQMMEIRRQTLKQHQQELQEIIPSLEALYRSNSNLSVRYFSGRDGLKIIRQEMVMQCSQDDMWHNLAPTDLIKKIFSKDDYYCRGRAAKGIPSRTIFSTANENTKKYLLHASKNHKTERKFVSPKEISIVSGISVFRDKIAIGSFSENIGGMIIQSDALADTMRNSLNLMWKKIRA